MDKGQAFHFRYWKIWRVKNRTSVVMETYQTMARESMMPFEKSCMCWIVEMYENMSLIAGAVMLSTSGRKPTNSRMVIVVNEMVAALI